MTVQEWENLKLYIAIRAELAQPDKYDELHLQTLRSNLRFAEKEIVSTLTEE